ncbi:hypothetical protein HT576_21635 [Haloterrigena sp. SYSU A121-1]|uniref:Uncharacterized protein n=1 Tax=Haloterrigena gelatinilytica TaxID=2741724 RepID=A0A8J8GT79_9EURY|nr:hypothetical protein [Haloterrigena gelatinilytica]NUB93587.1 hypothetical protein [Haloterrigena gelatinilytica]
MVGLTGTLAGCSGSEPAGDGETPSGEDGDGNGADEPSGFDASFLAASASSHVGATDGFADASWLAGTEPEVDAVTSLEGARDRSETRSTDADPGSSSSRSAASSTSRGSPSRTSSVVANDVRYNFERAQPRQGRRRDDREHRRQLLPRAAADADRRRRRRDDLHRREGPITASIAYNETDPSSIPVTGSGSGITMASQRPLWPDGLETVHGRQADDAVLSGVDARPADRTPHDKRILEHVREGTGAIIDSQEDVDGSPELEETTRALDVPDGGVDESDDGVDEWLAQWARAVEDPASNSPNRTISGDPLSSRRTDIGRGHVRTLSDPRHRRS